MPDFFVIVDGAGRIDCVSASLVQLLGYVPGELEGQPAIHIVETPTPFSADSAPLAWLDAGVHPVLNAIHRDGRRFPLRLTQFDVQGALHSHAILHLQDPNDRPARDSAFVRHRELYELATTQGRVGVWEIDYRTNHLEFSPIIGKLLGMAVEAIPRTIEGWKLLVNQDDWRTLEVEMTRMLRGEIPEMNLECRMHHTDGSQIWTLIRGKAEWSEGRPIRALGTTIDITERKLAEQRTSVEHAVARVLGRSPDLADAGALILQAICEALGWTVGAFWRVDTAANVLRCVLTWHASQSRVEEFERITTEKTCAPGVGLPGRVWPSRMPAWIPDVTRDDDLPRARSAAKAGLHAAFAIPVLIDDTVFGVLEFFNEEIRQPNDELLHMMAAIGNQLGQFLKRKKAEEERDLMFTLSLDLLCVGDLRGNFRRVNPAFTRTLGLTSAELLARPFLEFIHPDDIPATLDAMAGLQAGKDVIRFENRYRCADGSYRWLSWQCPAPAPGSDLLYAVARDVTDAKRVQQELKQAMRDAERASQAKSEFLSRMSHELRTPLNAILGFGQLLMREPLTGRQREHLDLIVKAGKILLHLINEALDITRIEVGRLTISSESVSLAEAVVEAVGLIAPFAQLNGITIRVDESTFVDRLVIADKQRLKQVLLNLLSNAVKYNSPAGMVHLSCEVSERCRLRLHVRDTGPGIPADKQHRLFVPFDRLGAESTDIEGSGLGLVLSRRLTEIMGGSLSFLSEPGLGTTFTIELPRGLAPEAQIGPSAAISGLEIEPRSAHRTVLCIEDNHANIKLVQAVLGARPGVQLLIAMQGLAGLEIARRQRPDLILLDVHLPDITGDKLLEMIFADADLRAIPVIVISADATAPQIERLLGAGATAYLTKPIDVDQLLQVVNRHLA